MHKRGLIVTILMALAWTASVPVAGADRGGTAARGRHAERPPRLLQVGPGREFALPSQAAAVARDGDTVELDAGDYRGDSAVWKADRLTLRGVGGMAMLHGEGRIANGKGLWVIKGDDAVVEQIGFLGARVQGKNGAGIRLEGTNLTVRHCLFRDNENGILTGANPDSEVLVEHSEFDANGHRNGKSHNLYIGKVRRFTLRYSWSHDAVFGHQVKSRAAQTDILYNLLSENDTARSSYSLDLPSGGVARVLGNVMVQGRQAENFGMVSIGAEPKRHDDNRLLMAHNTLVNFRPDGCQLLFAAPDIDPARAENNVFAGCARIKGLVTEKGNVSVEAREFHAAARGEFALRRGSPAIDKGIAAKDNVPEFQYVHPLQYAPRGANGAPDAGAAEYR